MFKSKTVFIVGAGASCEAGLPSGEALKAQIAKLLDIRFEDGYSQASGDTAICQALRQVKDPRGRSGGIYDDDIDSLITKRDGDINPLLHKAWLIRDIVPALAISIDNFLNTHQGDKEIELCGKLGIVKSILNAERNSKLRPIERGNNQFDLNGLKGTWYLNFFQMLTEDVPKSGAQSIFDNVSIITFNYDRCIERFLVQAVANYFALMPQEAENIVKKLKIYHPYGKVGELPWQSPGSSIEFGADPHDLLPIARQIRTFSEGMAEEGLLAEMHDLIIEAETVVFLGFAFHPVNMNLLSPDDRSNVKRVFSTTLGMSDSDEAVIKDKIFDMLGLNDLSFMEKKAFDPEMKKMACGDFFSYFFRSLSAEIETSGSNITKGV